MNLYYNDENNYLKLLFLNNTNILRIVCILSFLKFNEFSRSLYFLTDNPPFKTSMVN